MIDRDGFRPNVGIIITNDRNQVFWGKRVRQHAWQFPQGGIQKQIWFLLRLIGRDCDVRLRASDHPEFDAWRWNEYWIDIDAVIEFKRDVYRMALNELAKYLPQRGNRTLR